MFNGSKNGGGHLLLYFNGSGFDGSGDRSRFNSRASGNRSRLNGSGGGGGGGSWGVESSGG